MERQRQIEADRNKKALDRALAKPFVKVSKTHFRFWHPTTYPTVIFCYSTLAVAPTHCVYSVIVTLTMLVITTSPFVVVHYVFRRRPRHPLMSM